MRLTHKQLSAVHSLEKAQDHISKAMELIENAIELAPCILGSASYYTIPWLGNFKNNNTNQPGNIDGLIQSIKEEAGIEE